VEPLFLGPDDALDERPLLDNFGIMRAHDVADDGRQLVQERPADAELAAVADGAPEQPADDVAPPFVGRQDAVADGEDDRPDMVGDHLQRNVGLLPLLVADAGDFARPVNDRPEQIGVEVRVDILQNRREPLESRAGVDVLVRQRRVASVRVVVVLREHEVPHFEEPFVLAARVAFGVA